MNTDAFTKDIDLRWMASNILKRKWLILIPWVIVSLIAVGGSYLMTPEYESAAIVSIARDVNLSRELQGLLGIDQSRRPGWQSAELRGIYNEMTSSRYVALLDERLHLSDDAELQKVAREKAARFPEMTEQQIELDLLRNRLFNQIGITFVADDQIRIAIQSTDPADAKEMANTLADIFIAERLKQELSTIRSSRDFSDIQLQKYENRLQEKIREKTDFEKRFMQVQLDESITSESNRQEITGEIDRTDSDIEEYRRQEIATLQQLRDQGVKNTQSLKLEDSPNKVSFENEIKNQLKSLGNLMIKYTWSDPQVLNYKLKLNDLIERIEAENQRLVNEQYNDESAEARSLLAQLFNVRSNLNYLYAKSTYLEAALDDLNEKINLIPEYQAELNRLNQEISAARELRDKFQTQQESSSISQALLQDMQSSRYRVVEPAKLALAPFKPDRMRIILMGIVLGLVIGGAAAVLAELMDSSLKRVEDVEKHFDVTVLGVVPKMDFLKKVAK